MDKQRILKEAQKIAAKFSFWMVSGNISHLFGYLHETSEGKYELEIKFDDDFPNIPPDLVYHKEIKELLGDFQLETINNWTINSSVVDIIIELQAKIQQVWLKTEKDGHLPLPTPSEVSEVEQTSEQIKVETIQDANEEEVTTQETETKTEKETETEEYLTPDFDAYPPDFEYEQFLTPSEIEEDKSPKIEPPEDSLVTEPAKLDDIGAQETTKLTQPELFADHEQTSVAINTEIGLIQQEYAYDQKSQQKGDLNVYLTITLTKTFIIQINFNNYPKKPSELIDWKPSQSLADGLKLTIDWFSNEENLRNYKILYNI